MSRDESGTAPPIVPGAIHRVTIQEKDDRGRGISTLGRFDLRVANALPGEVLDVRLLHVGRKSVVGEIEEILQASRDRTADGCPHGTRCPGCGLRTTKTELRRSGKRDRLVAAFTAAGLPTEGIQPTVPAPAENHWRHKAYLTARRTKRGLFLGLYEEHSHRLLGIPGCPAHAPTVEKALAGVRVALGLVNPPTYDERSGQGWLRYVAVRSSASRGDALVTLVVKDRSYEGAREFAAEIRRRAPHVIGVVANLHPDPGNAPFGAEYVVLDGATEIEEDSGPFSLHVSAGSFFQVNPVLGARIQDDVREAAKTAPPGPALDLYGGVGATALRLAADGRDVRLVEAPGPAAEDARRNVAQASPGKVEVVAARVEEALRDRTAPAPAVVVVNPPRSGLSTDVMQGVLALKVPFLAYVSCDPRSLARDLVALVGGGYVLESVIPYDLMPQTPHVEALATLRRPA